jgi:hypothetical protein
MILALRQNRYFRMATADPLPLEESAGLKVKTLRPAAWNGIIKWAPEPEWTKLAKIQVFSPLITIQGLTPGPRFDPMPYPKPKLPRSYKKNR